MRGQRTTDLYGWKSISPSTTFSLLLSPTQIPPLSPTAAAMHKSYYNNYRCCCRGFGRTYLSADITVAAAVIVYLSQLERRQMLMMAEE